jgi:hypothetical protein
LRALPHCAFAGIVSGFVDSHGYVLLIMFKKYATFADYVPYGNLAR